MSEATISLGQMAQQGDFLIDTDNREAVINTVELRKRLREKGAEDLFDPTMELITEACNNLDVELTIIEADETDDAEAKE